MFPPARTDFSRSVFFLLSSRVGNDGRQLLIVGIFGAVLGLGALLLLLPGSSVGRATKILAVAASTITLGCLVIYLGRNADRTAGATRWRDGIRGQSCGTRSAGPGGQLPGSCERVAGKVGTRSRQLGL